MSLRIKTEDGDIVVADVSGGGGGDKSPFDITNSFKTYEIHLAPGEKAPINIDRDYSQVGYTMTGMTTYPLYRAAPSSAASTTYEEGQVYYAFTKKPKKNKSYRFRFNGRAVSTTLIKLPVESLQPVDGIENWNYTISDEGYVITGTFTVTDSYSYETSRVGRWPIFVWSKQVKFYDILRPDATTITDAPYKDDGRQGGFISFLDNPYNEIENVSSNMDPTNTAYGSFKTNLFIHLKNPIPSDGNSYYLYARPKTVSNCRYLNLYASDGTELKKQSDINVVPSKGILLNSGTKIIRIGGSSTYNEGIQINENDILLVSKGINPGSGDNMYVTEAFSAGSKIQISSLADTLYSNNGYDGVVMFPTNVMGELLINS
ncbi:MAG: hypothetical protein MJZ20_05770 [Bacteroidaceae bacterium]|nr:hypothetical protein [Bacteroidaceae bacterium]